MLCAKFVIYIRLVLWYNDIKYMLPTEQEVLK